MSTTRAQMITGRWGTAVAVAVACLTFAPLTFAQGQAADSGYEPQFVMQSLTSFEPADESRVHPGAPMVFEPAPGSLPFDLGDSETRKLQLHLAAPLRLEAGTQVYSSTALKILGVDTTVSVPLAPGLSLSAGADRAVVQAPFQTLGSIQCHNGVLRDNSYTASDCRFVDDPAASFDRRTLRAGAEYGIGNITSSISWFTSADEFGTNGMRRSSGFDAAALIDHRNFLQVPDPSLLLRPLPLQFERSQINGIDLNFQVGYTTGQAGEIRFGLALTHVLDAQYGSFYGNGIGPLDWNLAEPYNQASLGFEWRKGAFSTGVRGYYHEPISFLERNQIGEMGTFDVHFTWRTPWNANLSLGASNVLNAGVEVNQAADKPVDRFESIYGRIPYVRYQQDL